MKKMKWLLEEESGQGMAEYALILALVAMAVIGATTLFGTSLAAKYEAIANKIK
ncbi:MAG: Flp family type IVb pilin [Lachnospiraceae bacterium]